MQNIVILAGNIGQTPEVRTTQSGTKITNFSLATSRPRLSEGRALRDENGYRVMDTEWHRITCFNGLGKTVAEHCEKGMKVLVLGRLRAAQEIDLLGDDLAAVAVVPHAVGPLGVVDAAVDEDLHALFAVLRDRLAEAIEAGDAVPFGVHDPVAVLVAQHHLPRGAAARWRG